jgi:hypothetical protein
MNLPEPNDPISRMLAKWRVEPKANPNFRPAVWRRIQQRSRETWITYVQEHAAVWSVFTVVAVTAAGWVGMSAGRARLAEQRDAIVVSYLVGLDPRVQAKLRP